MSKKFISGMLMLMSMAAALRLDPGCHTADCLHKNMHNVTKRTIPLDAR
jgi:hypothetical protein